MSKNRINESRIYTTLKNPPIGGFFFEKPRKTHLLQQLDYFLTGVYTQAEDAIERKTALELLRTRYSHQFAEVRGAKKLARVIGYLIGIPITTITQAQEELGMGSYTTVQRDIERL